MKLVDSHSLKTQQDDSASKMARFLPLVLVACFMNSSYLLVGLTSATRDPTKVASVEEMPDVIISPTDGVGIDYKTGQLLPEEMNDGELEGELEGGNHQIEWTYASQNNWPNEYPVCGGVKLRQSPIDIITDEVVLKPNLELEFIDYNQEVEFQLKNTHHSISATPVSTLTTPSVKLNWLEEDGGEFELQDIHFHWGDGLHRGSEHKINGQRAAAEMHMVHYRKGINKADIGNIENSVVVVGVLIESDNVEHQKLDVLVKNAALINGTDDEFICGSPQNLINLLPDHHQSFYTYNGSLTTPPCYEVVTWILMSEPVYLSNDRLIELSNIERADPHGNRHKIKANNRDIQPLLERSVFASFNTSNSLSPSLNQAFKKEKFSNAFNLYWSNLEGINGSVRKALKVIEEAGVQLWSQIEKVSKSGKQ